MTNAPHRLRWFQVTLRMLLIAILVLSLPLSWFAVRMEKARRQKAVVEAIESQGGEVTCELTEPSDPQWMRRFLPDHFYIDVIQVWLDCGWITDAGL